MNNGSLEAEFKNKSKTYKVNNQWTFWSVSPYSL